MTDLEQSVHEAVVRYRRAAGAAFQVAEESELVAVVLDGELVAEVLAAVRAHPVTVKLSRSRAYEILCEFEDVVVERTLRPPKVELAYVGPRPYHEAALDALEAALSRGARD